jgi:hypothetical protein
MRSSTTSTIRLGTKFDELYKFKPIHTPISLSSRVISSPLAISLHHIDKRPRKAAISLLTRMQRIIPKEGIRVRRSNTIGAVGSAMIDIASDSRVSSIQVL